MKLKSNGGAMVVNQKCEVPGHHKKVWFSKESMTNIIVLKNLIQQCWVTCDSRELMFVIHRESANLPNIQFRVRESGLHCFNPKDKDFTFVSADFAFINAVAENKEGFTKRQIKSTELARNPHATLICPSLKDCK